jgi:Fe-S-cluster containining protein
LKDDLLQIAPASERSLSDTYRERLEDIYSKVPAVSCHCDRLGQCCELTEAEMVAEFATMYPLYAVEYWNIADYVKADFPEDRQEELLSVTEERPERCPFLTTEGGCSIHPVRPLVCRTFGVLRREQVETTASELRDEFPSAWVTSFLYAERQTVCPHTRVLEPEKIADHALRSISFQYQRELTEMGQEAVEMADDRRGVLEATSGRSRVKLWTWGGFNVLMRSPLTWMQDHFKTYWNNATLAE